MFTASMGIGMVAPILPLHARALGASGAAVGLTFSAFAITQILVSPFAGRLADRFGRKRFILAGIATYVVAALGWYATASIESVIALRALTGIRSGLVFALALASVGDLAPPGQEGRYMGAFGVFDFLGFGLGPVISGVVRDHAGIDEVFLSMAALMTVSGLVVAALLPAGRGAAGDGQAAQSDLPKVAPWRTILRDPSLQALFGLRTGFAFAFGASFSFLAVYLDEEVGATATMTGFVLAGQELVGGLLQPLLGPVADRVNRRGMAVAGSAGIVGGYITLALTTNFGVILVAFVLVAGLGAAVMHVAAAAAQVDVGRRLGMATTMSLTSMAFAVGTLLGSLGGGVIADRAGVPMVFGFAAAAIALGALFFALRTRGRSFAPTASRPAPAEGTADTPS